MSTAIRICAICGSLREKSYTRMALNIALRGAQETGAITTLIDLRDYDLTFPHSTENESEGTKRLREDVQQCQGILLGTPVYHGSFSGVLKNALDLMNFKQFEGRILGLIGVAGGSTGATVTVDALRTVGRALHAWVIPDEVSIAKAHEHFTDDGICKDAEVQARLLKVGRQVARFTYLHHADQTKEFMRMWETSIENPGAENPSS